MPAQIWIISACTHSSFVPAACREDAQEAFALAESLAKEVSPDVRRQGNLGDGHITWHFNGHPIVNCCLLHVNGWHSYFDEKHVRQSLSGLGEAWRSKNSKH